MRGADGLQWMFGEEKQDGGGELICVLYAGVRKGSVSSSLTSTMSAMLFQSGMRTLR
jgi:hypothetical protein